MVNPVALTHLHTHAYVQSLSLRSSMEYSIRSCELHAIILTGLIAREILQPETLDSMSRMLHALSRWPM